MAQAPPPGGYPPPPGGYPSASGHGQAHDPYAADRALEEWASQRGFVLQKNPDLGWYRAWAPFTYLSIGRVGRELRASLGDATVWLVEAYDADPIKQAAGEDRSVCAFLTSPRLTGRAALRSKTGGGLVNEVTSGLGSLFKGSAGGVLGDPTLEGRFDVSAPGREEGNRALPMALRQLLVQTGFRGVLEVKPGGMICALYELKSFEPAALDRALPFIAQLYQTACG